MCLTASSAINDRTGHWDGELQKHANGAKNAKHPNSRVRRTTMWATKQTLFLRRKRENLPRRRKIFIRNFDLHAANRIRHEPIERNRELIANPNRETSASQTRHRNVRFGRSGIGRDSLHFGLLLGLWIIDLSLCSNPRYTCKFCETRLGGAFCDEQ